ncbi:MAG: right-handed parallel beta-helix repeat-containing protein, partial [Verrucomicrobia bacterium]|nr:right-handed parallel beta-helix repeat-containing protein [Verrucomicrobiota bacterium]
MNLTKLISKIMLIGALITGVASAALKAETPRVLSAADYGLKPDSGKDAAPGISAALRAARKTGATRLVFAPGRYDIWPDAAFEKFLFVSNNDEGLKRIAFPLIDIKNLEIDGAGAEFVFHGPLVPFLIENSKGITLKNLSFDFARPLQSEGKVLAVTPESVDLEISEEFPYEIRNGILVFTGGKRTPRPETTVKSGEVLYPYGSLLAFDPAKRETAFMARDRFGIDAGLPASQISPGKVRINLNKVSAEPGQVLVFGVPREYPGIIISDSANVRLEGVNIYNCGGMGVIAQRSADIYLSKVRVTPAPGEKRVTSITADATHFVNCRGKITMVDCLFEVQKDDATNVHGLYAKI